MSRINDVKVRQNAFFLLTELLKYLVQINLSSYACEKKTLHYSHGLWIFQGVEVKSWLMKTQEMSVSSVFFQNG